MHQMVKENWAFPEKHAVRQASLNPGSPKEFDTLFLKDQTVSLSCEMTPCNTVNKRDCLLRTFRSFVVAAQVSFGRDFEQQLSFCVEARASFCNLEPVLMHLIHVSKQQQQQHVLASARSTHAASSSEVGFFPFMQTVNQLAMETSRVMRGNHSRKTAAFVRVSLTLRGRE